MRVVSSDSTTQGAGAVIFCACCRCHREDGRGQMIGSAEPSAWLQSGHTRTGGAFAEDVSSGYIVVKVGLQITLFRIHLSFEEEAATLGWGVLTIEQGGLYQRLELGLFLGPEGRKSRIWQWDP
jgi:hypothetical protein